MRAPFNPFNMQLPVTGIIPQIREALAGANTLLVSAPPGAGKSTVLPLALLDEAWLNGRKILVLEPRRLAAISIASRMADLLGEDVGQTIGYRIRFENRTSRQTRLEVVTEGILTRMLHHDNALEDVGLILFDEFHERSIHADISLALTREVQEVLRPDLRLVVMSATLDLAPLAGMLDAPVVESHGRQYPVEVVYTGHEDPQELPERCSRTILRAMREHPGDLLAFLPGQAEIRKCQEILKRQSGNFIIHPLYGQLNYAEQHAALVPDPSGRRKVVLATSIAETSLTIEGVRIVVDSGLTRKSVFDPGTGLSGLKTVQVSVDSADQRAGRAGRLDSGVCYRMWSSATHSRLAPYRTPEILDSDLAPLVLDLMEWGIRDEKSLCWLDEPPAAAMASARTLLEALEAIDGDRLTDRGKRIHRLPCHPRIANMLVRAEEAGTLPLATDLAALLEERDPLDRQVAGAELNLRVEVLRRYRAGRHDRRLAKIEKAASAYRKLFGTAADDSPTDPHAAGLLVASAYPERIAARGAGDGIFRLANGQTAVLPQSDDLSREPWLAVAQLDSQKGQGKIFLAAPLNPADVSHLARETETIRWDSRKGQLVTTTDLRIGSLVLESRLLDQPDPVRLDRVISETVRTEGRALLNFTAEFESWQHRVLALRRWNPDQDWPDVSTDALLEQNEEWLGPYFGQLRKADDFRKLDLRQVLQHFLSHDQQMLLDRLAPSGITVPSGSVIKVSYGEAEPVMAVRLQEVFGMLETPKVNGGAKNIVMHLLSPGFKPVQVTSDLRSFWQNTYFEVRKELKRRYPKHSWPDDPLQAEPVRGVRRR